MKTWPSSCAACTGTRTLAPAARLTPSSRPNRPLRPSAKKDRPVWMDTRLSRRPRRARRAPQRATLWPSSAPRWKPSMPPRPRKPGRRPPRKSRPLSPAPPPLPRRSPPHPFGLRWLAGRSNRRCSDSPHGPSTLDPRPSGTNLSGPNQPAKPRAPWRHRWPLRRRPRPVLPRPRRFRRPYPGRCIHPPRSSRRDVLRPRPPSRCPVPEHPRLGRDRCSPGRASRCRLPLLPAVCPRGLACRSVPSRRCAVRNLRANPSAPPRPLMGGRLGLLLGPAEARSNSLAVPSQANRRLVRWCLPGPIWPPSCPRPAPPCRPNRSRRVRGFRSHRLPRFPVSRFTAVRSAPASPWSPSPAFVRPRPLPGGPVRARNIPRPADAWNRE
jgi:hypothetical protein